MISKLCKRDLRASWINRNLRWTQALIKCHRCHRKWTIQIKILKSIKKCLMTSRQGSKLISTQRKWSNVSRSSWGNLLLNVTRQKISNPTWWICKMKLKYNLRWKCREKLLKKLIYSRNQFSKFRGTT